MQIQVTKDSYVDFATTALAVSPKRDRPSYVQFPDTRGVYIFHLGPLRKNWLQTEKILYIGETNRQGLRKRIPINYRGKIRHLIDIDISEVCVSFSEIQDNKPTSLSKLIERALLYAYEKKFGDFPPCNNE